MKLLNKLKRQPSSAKRITHEGEIKLMNDTALPCYVLEDGTRVLSGRGMQNALQIVDNHDRGEEKKPGAQIARFLSSNWFKLLIASKYELEHFKPISCYKGSQKINGFEATTLVDVCNIILENRELLTTPRQITVANQADVLVRSFAKTGIIALVDEATGYQKSRPVDALQTILKAYISDGLLAWQKRFPDTFYKEIYRLNKWENLPHGKCPSVVGRWTNQLIYEHLPAGVLEELKIKTPKSEAGNYVAKFHQGLSTDIGHPHLQAQINTVIALMQVSDNWHHFTYNFNKMLSRKNGQTTLIPEEAEH
jgi:hypothetical protein